MYRRLEIHKLYFYTITASNQSYEANDNFMNILWQDRRCNTGDVTPIKTAGVRTTAVFNTTENSKLNKESGNGYG